MKIRVRITRKTKEDACDNDAPNALKPPKSVAHHESKVGALHDSIASDTLHSSFNSSTTSTQLLSDSFSLGDHALAVAATGRGRSALPPSKEKVRMDLERFFSLQKGHKSAHRFTVSSMSASLADPTLKKQDNKLDQTSAVRRNAFSQRRSRSRTRSKTPAAPASPKGGRRCHTPDARGDAYSTSVVDGVIPSPRRNVPRRSKSLGFRTSDEIIQAYDEIQNQEVAQAEQRDLAQQAKKQMRANITDKAPNKTKEKDRQAISRRVKSTKSGALLSDDLLQAYESIVSDFEQRPERKTAL